MASKTRKRQSTSDAPGAGPAPGSASESHAASWTAPTAEEFLELRRYKSFLLPPNLSYYVNQFVWLAHEGSQPAVYDAPPSSKKARRSSYNSPSAGIDGEEDDRISESALERSETDARWKAGLWLGRIVEIRARDTSYVWMKIRWMCRTVKELRDQSVRSGLPKGKVGGREIFQLGSEFDALQPVGAVEAHANVILFDESNPMQDPIGERDIFFRSEAKLVGPEEAEQFGISMKAAKSKSGRKSEPIVGPIGHLFPYTSPTCYCGEGYLPLSDRTEPMAFCANEGCGKWFHLACLDWKQTHRREPTDSYQEYVRTSGLHLADLLPEAKDDPTGSGSVPPAGTIDFMGRALTELQKQSNGKKEAEVEPLPTDDLPPINPSTLAANAKLDELLPESIRLCSTSAIVRGDKANGIVGNARKVIAARVIIDLNRRVRSTQGTKRSPTIAKKEAAATALIDGELPEQKLKRLVDEWETSYGNDQGEKRVVLWLCPSCRRAM